MCFSLAILYGFFELGGGEMKSECLKKLFCLIIILLAIILVLTSIYIIYTDCKPEKAEPEITELTINLEDCPENARKITLSNVYVYQKGKSVPKEASNILFINETDVSSDSFEKLGTIKNLYFLDKNIQSHFKKIAGCFKKQKILKMKLTKSYLFIEIVI